MTLSGDLTVPGDHDLDLQRRDHGQRQTHQTGSGTLVLARANTCTGATTVSVGTLALGSPTPSGPRVRSRSPTGATLDLAGYSETMGSLRAPAPSPAASPVP